MVAARSLRLEARRQASERSTSGGRKRVAILASHFADYSVELALEASRGHDVLLLADPDKLAAECGEDQLARARARMQVAPLHQASRVRRMVGVPAAAAAVALFRPDILIAHEHAHPHLSWLQRVGGRRARVILIVHDPEPHPGRDAALAQAGAAEVAAQRRNADVLVAHGAWCGERLRDSVGEKARVEVAPHGPILKPTGPVLPPPGGRRVLMFGRMEAYKGLDVLLAAFRRLQGTDAKLEIIGDGPELRRLEADFRQLPAVTIARGYAAREALIAALARTDLVAAPYTQATQSGVVAGAFANARPVLASAVGGLPDYIVDGVNGRLVPPGEADELARVIGEWPQESAHLWTGAIEASTGPLSWRAVMDVLEVAP